MTSLARKLQKIFASSATSDVRAFGKLAAGGTIIYSQDPDVIQSLGAFLTGWKDAVVGNHSPSLQDFDSLLYLITYQLAYLTQRGMPQYLATQTYDVYDMCMDPAGTGIYVSQQTNNIGNALNNPTWWLSFKTSVAPTPALCKAWVRFSGSNGVIFAGYNVADVSRVAAGKYRIDFTTPLNDQNPAWAGTAGDSGTLGGDTNHLIEYAPASVNSIYVGNWTAAPPYGYADAGTVMVQVFGS